MSTSHLSIVALALAAASAPTALADPAPRAPDFTQNLPERGVDRSLSASQTSAPIEPSDDIAFALDSDLLSPVAEDTLSTIAHWANTHRDEHLVVVAHADASGTLAYNEQLATRRGHRVRDYLSSAGVAGDRVIVVACAARDRSATIYATSAETDTTRCR